MMYDCIFDHDVSYVTIYDDIRGNICDVLPIIL